MVEQTGCLWHTINAFIIIVMAIEGLESTKFHARVFRSFSFWGYFLSFLVQLFSFIYNIKGSYRRSRAYWLLRQFSWTSNIIITIVFWGPLYSLPELQKILKANPYIHLVMIFMHSFPILADIKEMFCTRIEYRDGDYKWTIVFLLCYGAVNIVDAYYVGAALYPLLTWKDAMSIVFVVAVIIISYSSHKGGAWLSKRPETKETKTS